MNKISLVFSFLVLKQVLISAQTFCLNFEQVSNNGTELVIDLQIAGSGNFNLGTSNFEFTYNGSALSNPTLVSSPISTPSYQVPTFTSPAANTLSFNTELNFAPGFAVGTTFTDFARVKFTITNPSGTSNLHWSYNGSTTATVVFLDDDFTQIYAGSTGVGCLMPLDIVVPVKLTHFQAEAKGMDALLTWETATEQNLSHYDIERSTDQRQWHWVGQSNGQNNTYTSAIYQWTDANALRNAGGEYVYYRLKMVDTDGSFEYSPIRSVQVSKSGKIVRIQPNPVSETLHIYLPDIDRDAAVTATLYDFTGKLVLQTSCNASTVMDVSTLPRGMYTLQLTERNTILATERVAVQ